MTDMLEPGRRTRARAQVDVVVCGGGRAGAGATLAAARAGVNPLVVGHYGCLGGARRVACPTGTIVAAGQVQGVFIESQPGREALATVVVDATGDRGVAASAGAPYEYGRPGGGLTQPVGLF